MEPLHRIYTERITPQTEARRAEEPKQRTVLDRLEAHYWKTRNRVRGVVHFWKGVFC